MCTQEETFCQPLYRDNMKGKEGVWGASTEANRMKRSQIKLKLLLFDESDFFFLLRPVYFLFSFNRAMFILSQIKKRVFFFFNQIRLSNGGLKITYNLCIVKKAKLEISGSHR